MTKIILAQIDTLVCDIKYNFEKIKNNIIKAKEENAKMIIFPEYALVGYPFGDVLKRHKSILKEQENAIKEIAELTENITAIFGYAGEFGESKIAICSNGNIFNGNEIQLDNKTFLVISGEYDTLDNQEFEKSYDGIIHISASDSRNGKEYLRNKTFSEIAKNNKAIYIYTNAAGYNDNLCFEGTSRIYTPDGKISAKAKCFEEDFLVITDFCGDIKHSPNGYEKPISASFDMNYENDLDRTYQSLICGIKGYFSKKGFKKAVLGLSGGLDSTICAALLADALGKDNVYGISMPTRISSQAGKDDAKILAQNLGINYLEVPIENVTGIFSDELKKIFQNINADKYQKSTTFENIQARTRATILWSISNECKSMLPIATSDKSEAYIGYATTNGDMSGGFAPIADITKTKLFALGHFLNKKNGKNIIPQNILEKPPGAELKFDEEKGRTITAEEDNMPYPFLDEIVWLIENKNYGKEDLFEHKFFYEKTNTISKEQKAEWISKFFDKMGKAVFKWHILPPSIITDTHTINQSVYYQPI